MDTINLHSMKSKDIADKSKFFGLYINQKVMGNLSWENRNVKMVDIEMSRSNLFQLWYLDLRDVRAILKKHLVHLWKRDCKNHINKTAKVVSIKYYEKCIVLEYKWMCSDGIPTKTEDGYMHSSWAFGFDIVDGYTQDYLRSNGYLLPFNGYTKEHILKKGWAKYLFVK